MSIQSIAKYFREDHARLDQLFRKFQGLKRSDFGQAGIRFKEFKFGLERHIAWEEDLLFPLFEAKTGMRNAGPTMVMRMEHIQIRETLGAIQAKINNQNPRSEEDESALLNVLGAHNQKEEGILYPMIDDAANDEERREIFEKMNGYPTQSKEDCSGC